MLLTYFRYERKNACGSKMYNYNWFNFQFFTWKTNYKKLLNSLPLSVCILCLVIIYFGLAAYGVKYNTFSNLNYIRLFFFGKYLKSFVRSLASEIRDYQTKHRTFKRPPGMLCTTQTWFYRYLHREPSFAPLSRCLILSFYK